MKRLVATYVDYLLLDDHLEFRSTVKEILDDQEIPYTVRQLQSLDASNEVNHIGDYSITLADGYVHHDTFGDHTLLLWVDI